jgi:putative heme-binding domain-containing protein
VISTQKVRSTAALALFLLASVPQAKVQAAETGLGRLVSLASGSTDPEVRRDILRGMEAAVRGRNGLIAPEGWDALEEAVGSSGDDESKSLVRNMGVAFGSRRALEALKATAADVSANPTDRSQALAALLRTRDPALTSLLQKLVLDPATRGVAIRGLAGFDDARTPEVILSAFPALASAEQRDALNTLASRTAYARPLLEAVRAGGVPKSALTADLVRQLRSLKDAKLAASLTEIWGVVRETSPDMTAEVERVKRVYWAGGSTPGDAPRGRVVFNQVCAQCHHLFDSGGSVGPDITGANRGDLDYLLQNILYPNAVIPNEYRASTVELKDERVLTGLVKSQDANSVVVQTANELLTLPRAEVRKIEGSEISMMPEGLVAGLTEPQIRDLLYYLSRPGQVPLPAGTK